MYSSIPSIVSSCLTSVLVSVITSMFDPKISVACDNMIFYPPMLVYHASMWQTNIYRCFHPTDVGMHLSSMFCYLKSK